MELFILFWLMMVVAFVWACGWCLIRLGAFLWGCAAAEWHAFCRDVRQMQKGGAAASPRALNGIAWRLAWHLACTASFLGLLERWLQVRFTDG